IYLLLTFGRRFHRKAGAIPEESLSSARCRCLFGQMPVSVLGETRLSGARSNRLEGLESHRVGDTGRQGYKKKRKLRGLPLLWHSNLNLNHESVSKDTTSECQSQAFR
ncbi:hypothetical protein, partial [Bacteroides fragilis]|uniref:hypothetical protein n=1 Tax=Bacteroides fragilis TaxID=817 RepID=UPI001955E3B3